MYEFPEIYSKIQKEQIAAEFCRLKDCYYLEHVGATLYSDVQISNVFEDLKCNVYGNPHAFNTSSKYTEDIIDQIRSQVLTHFNTNLDEYSIIFTSGATGALKLVAEAFNYSNGEATAPENGIFMYLQDNHTSVLGMREYAKNNKIMSNDEAFHIFNNRKTRVKTIDVSRGNSLFVYAAQSNFSGTKYPLRWIKKIQNGIMNDISGIQPTKWFCMLDAASFVACNKLDLSLYKPDFVCLSFYKIFGYPTGLGALIVKNSSAAILTKRYFGGGTVQMALDTEYVPRTVLHERFEDGTIPFLTIVSLRHGFETLKRLSLNMDLISEYTFSLAKYVHHNLLQMHHSNGNPVAFLYHDTNFEDREFQGGIVNFNLLRTNGEYIGYAQVLHMANLYKIQLRTGCFCNPGACQKHLKLTPLDVKRQFNEGHICGDQNDLINGYPTGSVRISFGYMSTKEDADQFLQMIEDCFITKPIIRKLPEFWNKFERNYKDKFLTIYSKNNNFTSNNHNKSLIGNITKHIKKNVIVTSSINLGINIRNENVKTTLRYIFVYPVKSCGAYSVENVWNIESTGLCYDREWMIVTSTGVSLTQKYNPKLCLIKPNIKLKEGILELSYSDMPTVCVPLNISDESFPTSEVTICQSKVCGDRVKCIDCGDEIAAWLCKALQISDLRLYRQNSNHLRTNRKGEQSQLSLVNQANYLLINIASIKHLANLIPNFELNDENIYNLIARFRANLVIDSSASFIENSHNEIKIGNHLFKSTGSCTRCQIICIDQLTAEKTIEPLRTLSSLTDGKIKFGVYLSRIFSTTKEITKYEKVVFQ